MKTRKLLYVFAILFTLFFSSLKIKANDGLVNSVSYKGITLSDGKNTSIRMDSEYVEIKLYEGYFTVNATFWLYNTGKKIKANVGFPQEGSYGGSIFLDESTKSNYINEISYSPEDAIDDLVTTVNDSIVPFRTYKNVSWNAETNDKESLSSLKDVKKWLKRKGKFLKEEERSMYVSGDYFYWYVKKVIFPANTTTKTAISFKSGYNYNDPDKYGKYIFGSGNSWKGDIIKSIFHIKKAYKDSSVLSIEINDKYENNGIVKRKKGINEETLEFTNYKPDDSDEIQFNLNEPVEQE